MHRPSVIFMDGPLVELDEETVFRLKTMMKDYCSHGGSILCSTHLYDKVSDVCDRCRKNGVTAAAAGILMIINGLFIYKLMR